jgi:hypothetical protein
MVLSVVRPAGRNEQYPLDILVIATGHPKQVIAAVGPKRTWEKVARGLDHDDRGHGLEPFSLK